MDTGVAGPIVIQLISPLDPVTVLGAAMMTKHLDVQISDPIMQIRMNRPGKLNALTREMYSMFTQALNDADQDDSVRVIVISGTDDCFTAGNDLHEFLNVPPTHTNNAIFRFIQTLPSVKKPLIAAVNGNAIGIGTTLLLHCDLVYAADNARFQMPFVSLGLIPEAGSSLILPKLMGHRKAFELLLFGDTFDAHTAVRLGLVNDISPPSEVLPFALRAAARLADQPFEAMMATKALLKQQYTNEIQTRIREEAECFVKNLQSDDTQRALTKRVATS